MDMTTQGDGGPRDLVPEVLLDPRWRGRLVTIDGKRFPVLTLEHPRHGDIHWLLEQPSRVSLVAWLHRALAELGETVDVGGTGVAAGRPRRSR